MSLAVIFPGQGAQAPALGAPWVDQPQWSIIESLSDMTGVDIAHLLLDANRSELADTHNSQLVVLAASLLAWAAAEPILSPATTHMAGHSLGQVTALIASGTIDERAGLEFARNRAVASRNAQSRVKGGLIALLGADESVAIAACARFEGRAWPANFNSVGQIVLGGELDILDDLAAAALELGARRASRLPVDGSFHTPLMLSAVDELTPTIDALTFRTPRFEILSNDTGGLVDDPNAWSQHLAAHMVKPVRWVETVRTMASAGVTTLVEVGPGTTLTSLAKRIDSSLNLVNFSQPADLKTLSDAADSLRDRVSK